MVGGRPLARGDGVGPTPIGTGLAADLMPVPPSYKYSSALE